MTAIAGSRTLKRGRHPFAARLQHGQCISRPILLIEIGGPQEAEAAAWIKANMSKPVVGFVAGLTAPKGRRMGHAGAIISAVGDSAAEKTEIMRCYGLAVAPSPGEFGSTMAEVLSRSKTRRAVG